MKIGQYSIECRNNLCACFSMDLRRISATFSKLKNKWELDIVNVRWDKASDSYNSILHFMHE